MKNKPLLSITIPTYNRAIFLENLLNCITPQARELGEIVEICISNNGSSDNTKEVVSNFQKKYPGLIKYNENEKNLGFDKNMFKVIEMAQGDFVWLFGDDDLVVKDGIKKVINFIKNHCNKDTGLIALANSLYFIDDKTGKKIVYDQSIEKGKPEAYEISHKDIIGECFPSSVFISILLFNNSFLKKILKEEKIIVERAIKTGGFIHTFLYRLMFLKFPKLEALRFNKIIIETGLNYFKFYIDDIFKLYYIASTGLDDLLLSSEHVNDYYKKIIINKKRRQKKILLLEWE